MEVPLITRQYGFNYATDFIYEPVVNELEEEVNIENEIISKSLPGLTKSKSEEYNKNCIKVKRSYSY